MPGCTALSPVLQDFVEHGVMQTSVCQMSKYNKNKNSCFPAGCADTAAEDGRRCSNDKNLFFPEGCADAAVEDGRRGSNVYKINLWLWQFLRGKPRLGGLTIEETAERQVAASNLKASDKRGKETREVSKGIVPDWNEV
jgi:hypothetical protein